MNVTFLPKEALVVCIAFVERSLRRYSALGVVAASLAVSAGSSSCRRCIRSVGFETVVDYSPSFSFLHDDCLFLLTVGL